MGLTDSKERTVKEDSKGGLLLPKALSTISTAELNSANNLNESGSGFSPTPWKRTQTYRNLDFSSVVSTQNSQLNSLRLMIYRNHELTNLCCFNCYMCGNLLWQQQETNTHMQRRYSLYTSLLLNRFQDTGNKRTNFIPPIVLYSPTHNKNMNYQILS